MAIVEERPVLVTTIHRGVFFGYVSGDIDGETIKLRRARNCLYWSDATRGVLGLAERGPQAGSRVGPPADITLYGVTLVAKCTPEAVAAWESAPWE